jgi:methylenetetrahydrofolate dehydrogenase (NADP+)/methenyltetrahydrofolate cyclohydrolase
MANMQTATLIDGKTTAQQLQQQLAARVERITAAAGQPPCLATVLVGADPGSVTYTRMKRNRCEKVGMRSMKVELDESTTTEQLLGRIRELGDDPSVNGILLQHPVPEGVDERAAFEAIPPEKDVDGTSLSSFGAMWFDLEGFDSCTPGGIMKLLDAYHVDLKGKHAVVIGRSAILGKPMAGLLLNRHATVTICHSRTADLPGVVRQADVVVAAVGKPKFVQGDWIKQGAVVMDAGYNPGNVGDVDFEAAAERASLITPVPGGVGPMTIATLLEQTADAAVRQWQLDV